MFREVTIGQYYPADSKLHKLDPRVKLFGTLVFVVSLFMADNIIGVAVTFIAMAVCIAMSKVPFKHMLKGLKGIIFILVFCGVFNLFLTPGKELVHVWRFTITWEGLMMTLKMLYRMVCLVVGTSLMTLTTTPNQLTDGLEKSFKIFSKMGVPVHEIALMMSIALRFIPILIEETDKIMKAQMARGADFSSGGPIKRAKAMIPLLVPLFVSAFRRANDLAYAMEARCYNGGDHRTKMKPLVYSSQDQLAYIILWIYVVLFVIARVAI